MADFKLHEKQAEVLRLTSELKKRYVVFAAGRRSGKSYLAAIWLLLQALEEPKPGVTYGPTARVLYVAPTIGMAIDIMQDLFMEIAGDYIQNFSARRLEFTLVNGRKVKLAGCDKTRSLRGGSLIALALDEVQDVNIPEVWDRVLRPATGDLKANCLFIGTPLPGTAEEWHALYRRGLDEENPNWASVHCNSTDNPFIDMQSEVDQARLDGVSETIINQEYFASFELTSASQFDTQNVPTYTELPQGTRTYISVDLMGFKDISGLTIKEIGSLDETVISVVSVDTRNHWYVRNMITGRWGVEETARRIARAAAQYQPHKLGLEAGVLKNAVLPFLQQELNTAGAFISVNDLKHGNVNKVDRVFWALQGRFERGMIHYPDGAVWCEKLNKQLNAFPNRYVHDDMPDSLAYIQQLADAAVDVDAYLALEEESVTYDEPIDETTGY